MVDLCLDLDKASGTYKDFLVVNGDLVLTNDAPNSPNGNNPVEQDVLQRLSMFLGEWYLDNTQGTPWFQQILVKNPNISNIEGLLKNIILGTPGVQNLTKFSFVPNFAARNGQLTFSIFTAGGQVNYNGILAPVYAGNQNPGVLSP